MQEIKTNIGGDAPLPKTLSVGSVVYRLHNNEITHIITIDRITKTQAISNNGTYSMRFNINVSKFGGVTEISASRNYWEKYSIETPELKEQYLRQLAVLI